MLRGTLVTFFLVSLMLPSPSGGRWLAHKGKTDEGEIYTSSPFRKLHGASPKGKPTIRIHFLSSPLILMGRLCVAVVWVKGGKPSKTRFS